MADDVNEPLKASCMRFPEPLMERLDSARRGLGVSKTAIMESSMSHFMDLPQSAQRQILGRYNATKKRRS